MGVHRRLYGSALVEIGIYACDRAPAGPDPEERTARPEIAVPLRGSFVKHVGDRAVTCDVLSAAAFNPGETYRVSHPHGGGDVSLTLAPALPPLLDLLSRSRPGWGEDPERPFGALALRLDGAAALALRLLREALVAPGEAAAVDELAADLMSRLSADAPAAGPGPARGATRSAHRTLAEAARRQLRQAAAPIPLAELARRLGCAPFHLARVFRRETGWSLHGYGTRVRLEAALDRLGDGEDLSRIAAALGFADQAHLTRRFRQAFGTTPSAFRRRLSRVGRRGRAELPCNAPGPPRTHGQGRDARGRRRIP